MDVSDGLVGDLAKLLSASGVGAEIDLDAVPLSAAARAAIMADPALLELAWTGGDDYEILCTASETEYPALVGGGGGGRYSADGHRQDHGASRAWCSIARRAGRAAFARGSFTHF